MALHRFMMALARGMAVLGGIVLSLLILLTCVSILGRLLNGLFHSAPLTRLAPGFSEWMIAAGIGPVNGDFELVESGVAFAIFAFIPLCQITAGHASVALLTDRFSLRVNRVLRMVIEIVFAAVLILIAVQLAQGMLSKRAYGETTFLLQFPIWWAYALSLVAAATAALVGSYVAAIRVVECLRGQTLLDDEMEAEH